MSSNNDNSRTPSGHDKMITALTRSLATPKSEIDRREKEWQEQVHKRGRPKKKKPSP